MLTMAAVHILQSLGQTAPFLSWFKLVNDTVTEPYLVCMNNPDPILPLNTARTKSSTFVRRRPTAMATFTSGIPKSPHLQASISHPTSSRSSEDAASLPSAPRICTP